MMRFLYSLRRCTSLVRWAFHHKLLILVSVLLLLYLSGDGFAYDAVDYYGDVAVSVSGVSLDSVARQYIGSDCTLFNSYYGYDDEPWCANFVSYCAEETGLNITPSAACDDLYRFNGGIRGVAGIAVGDVLFFDWDADEFLDHVGIVSYVDADSIETIEGNVDNTVKFVTYEISDSQLFGYVRLGGGYGVSMASYSVSASDNVGSSYLTMFQGLASKISPVHDYVYARTGSNTYVFAWGDIKLDGSTFSGSADYIVYERSDAYNSVYLYKHYHDDSFVLNAGEYLVYSSLGSYPAIGGNEYARFEVPFIIAFFVLLACGIFLLPLHFRNR